MDIVSHGAWGYASLHRHRDLRWWAVLAGAAPDLLWFVPSTVNAFATRGWDALRLGSQREIWRSDGPPLPAELVDSYFRYYIYTHSLVLLALVTTLVLATRWRRYAWLAVPYARALPDAAVRAAVVLGDRRDDVERSANLLSQSRRARGDLRLDSASAPE
jgi:hypothetical protein